MSSSASPRSSSGGKRKRGADDGGGLSGGASPLDTAARTLSFEEEGAAAAEGSDGKAVKLPAHTLLYMPLVLTEKQRVALHDHAAFLASCVDGRRLYRSTRDARAAAAGEAASVEGARVRLVELQTLKALQLLDGADDVALAAPACCDGVVRRDGAVLLDDGGGDLLRVVDEDKQPGKSQQLISDMFARMAIGGSKR